jgi:hypothetical protein
MENYVMVKNAHCLVGAVPAVLLANTIREKAKHAANNAALSVIIDALPKHWMWMEHC